MKYFFLCTLVLFINCSAIRNKLAFFANRDDLIHGSNLPHDFKEVFVDTYDNKQLSCLYRIDKSNRKIGIYFHGNAENVYQNISVMNSIFQCGINIFGVEYRGYGKSTGRPSENKIIDDDMVCFQYVVDSLHYEPKDIVIIGRSIGTAFACNIALNNDINRLVLVTPISTGKKYARVQNLGLIGWVAGKSFDNITKLQKIHCPVLIVGASDDAVMPPSMVHEVYSSAQGEKALFWVNGAHHNDIFFRGSDSLWKSICSFIK